MGKQRARSLAVVVTVTLGLVACSGNGGEPVVKPEGEASSGEASPTASVTPGGEASPGAESPTASGEDDQSTEPAVAVDWTPATVGGCDDLDGYNPQDETVLTDQLLSTLAEPGGAFRADADLGPLTKAILLVEASDGVLPHARYRLRYGVDLVDAPPAADPVQVSFVQIDRFNLGPAQHAAQVESLGEDVVADVDEFGVGPHVSYCLRMQSLMGMTADLTEASRAEVPDAAAHGIDCLGTGSCTSLDSLVEAAREWEDTGPVGINVVEAYDALRDGVWSPAAAMDLTLVQARVATEDGGLIRWSGFEPSEGPAPGEPFVDVVIETGLGQDSHTDVALRDGFVMDHSVQTFWQRVSSFPSGIDEQPVTQAYESFDPRSAD